MTTISDLSWDLVDEILSRVPLTSQRAVRSTCKRWNSLSKDQSFTKKHLGKAPMVIMVCGFRVCLMRIDLQGIHNHKDELSITQIGKLNQLQICEVHHCDGLLLCLPRYRVKSDLVVWNPYLGQVKRIKSRPCTSYLFDKSCIGYDNNNNHKILRFSDWFMDGRTVVEYDIYDFESNSWRLRNFTPNWYRPHQFMSLKGNTYFVAQHTARMIETRVYLICFDFTREIFGPRLDLQVNSCSGDSVILSAIREEKLAVLFYRRDTDEMEIRVTTKIEANAVSWSNFLKFDMNQLTRMFFHLNGCFFVDEKKKVAVICYTYLGHSKSYVIGKNGYHKKLPLKNLGIASSFQLNCSCSYVPSSVQIQQGPEPTLG